MTAGCYICRPHDLTAAPEGCRDCDREFWTAQIKAAHEGLRVARCPSCGRIDYDVPGTCYCGHITPETMSTLALLTEYRDGDERGWSGEFQWLEDNHLDRLDALTALIEAEGIREPILLGNDRRVWDGHHRLAVARRLGLEEVPVRFA